MGEAVTAINLLLEPDATMLERCAANNARLLAVFPHGFALDESHRPHITLLQRFVRTADLDDIYSAADTAFANTDVRAIELQAYRYYYIPSGNLGLAGIFSHAHPALVELQQQLIDAVAPFTVESGTSAAFVTTADDPVIDPMLIAYVSAFVPSSTGPQYSPHVTTGVAQRGYLDEMLAEPFEPFPFSPTGGAVYQLGQYGTAAKLLHR